MQTHNATGFQGTSADIVVSTGVPDASFFSLSSSANNPSGAFNTDGVEVTFINYLPVISLVTILEMEPVSALFPPEAGNITNSCFLSNGICSVVWRSSATSPG